MMQGCCDSSSSSSVQGVKPPVAAAIGHLNAGSESSLSTAAVAAADHQSAIAAEMLEVNAAWVKHKGPSAGEE
jgi:hypothetical protein